MAAWGEWSAEIPLDRISEQAERIKFGRTVLTILAGLLFGFGWVVAKVFAVIWLAVAWSAAAVTVGWQEARSGTAGPD